MRTFGVRSLSCSALGAAMRTNFANPAALKRVGCEGARAGVRCSATLSSAGLGANSAAAVPAAAAMIQVAPRAVGWWLVGTSASVFAMVVVGGITRLTRSGLSMTDWRPQGKRWPRDAAEWEAEFDRWKQFPEYQRLYMNADGSSSFSLDDFKKIFFWEWFHRMMGRSIGLVYGVPLAYFALRGQIPRSLAPTLAGLLVLGGSQGLVGWWMVKSGLDKARVEEIDGGIPTVSPYRLAAHLTCAFTIFTILLYTGLGILQPRVAAVADAVKPVQVRVRMLAVLIGVTAISGAFVAGRQAGLAFNTFPLMEGRVIPEGYMELQPLYRNFFESVPSVQVHATPCAGLGQARAPTARRAHEYAPRCDSASVVSPFPPSVLPRGRATATIVVERLPGFILSHACGRHVHSHRSRPRLWRACAHLRSCTTESWRSHRLRA